MSKGPVHEIRLGLIKACIWMSRTSFGNRYNVTVCQLYKKGDVWKESSHFGRDDLLLLAKVIDQAHTWIHGQEKRERSASEEQAATTA